MTSIQQYGENSVSTVIIVDNGSTDASLNFATSPNLSLQVIRNLENRGFAAACNQGAALCSSPYLLFLNPDAGLREDALQKSVGYLEDKEAANIGILGVRLINEHGTTQRHCARFPSWSTYLGHALALDKVAPKFFRPHFMTDFDHLTSRDVDQVIGAFFLVRRSVFECLNGFDERFFVYFEELDFSLRARQAGWRTWYLAEAVAFHKGGGTSEQVKAHRLFYSLRSRFLYAFKHFSPIQAWIVLVAGLVIEPISRLIRCALRGSRAELYDTLRGYRMLWSGLPATLRQARQRDA